MIMQHLQTRNQQEGKTGRQDMADAPAYVDLDATLALSKNMKKEINENSEQCKLCNTCFLDAKAKRLIHTIIAGSIRTPARLAYTLEGVEAKCTHPKCNGAKCDAAHMFWIVIISSISGNLSWNALGTCSQPSSGSLLKDMAA